MIRINLLPLDQGDVAKQGRIQMLLFAAVILALLGILGLIYVAQSSELEQLERDVQVQTQEIEQMEMRVKDANTLTAQKTQLEAQLQVLAELEAQKGGPIRMLDELQSMFNPPLNEQDQNTKKAANWNPDWDPQRLWIKSFKEGSGSFDITGSAVNPDDVVEFLFRLESATYFYNTKLDVVTAVTQAAVGQQGQMLRFVDFHITGSLSYEGKPGEEALAVDLPAVP